MKKKNSSSLSNFIEKTAYMLRSFLKPLYPPLSKEKKPSTGFFNHVEQFAKMLRSQAAKAIQKKVERKKK